MKKEKVSVDGKTIVRAEKWQGEGNAGAFNPHLRLFPFGGVDNGGATHFGHFVLVAVEGPTADLLTPNHVFNEQNPIVEAQTQLIKEFDVLQQIVVGGAEKRWKEASKRQ